MKYLLLILVVLALYLPAFPNKFVWDDEEQVVANTAVHSVSNIPSLLSGSTFNSGGSYTLGGLYYKPLMSISFAVIYSVFGPSPWAFHLFQISLHLGSTLLLFIIFKTLLKKDWLAFGLSLLFLVHPQNIETVVYISSLQDTLYMFFGLLGLSWLVISGKTIGWADLTFTAACLFLSLLGKETGFLFIPITGLYLLLYRTKQDVMRHALFSLIILALYLYLRLAVAGVGLDKNMFTPMATLPFITRLGNIPAMVWHYLSEFVFPHKLSISQHWYLPNPGLLSWFLLIALIATWFFILRLVYKSNKSLLFFWLWFGLALSFHLQLFPLDMTVADRWFYLPMVGLIGFLGSLKFKLFDNKRVLPIFVLIILALFVRSSFRIKDWRDGLTLYSHDITIMTESFDLENNLGVELYRNGDITIAKEHFARSTELAPTWWTNWNNLGVVIEAEGDLDTALSYYQKAIDHGNYYLAYGNYGRVLIKQNKFVEASKFVSDSLKIYPNSSTLLDLYQYLRILESNKGR